MSIWVILIVVCIAMSASKQHRFFRQVALGDHRQCRNCHGVFPSSARFCGQCGRPLQ